MTKTWERRWMVIALIALTLWLVGELQAMLMPFFMGILLAYLGDPVVDRLEARGMSRTGGVSVVFVIFTLLVILGFLVVVPMLFKQIQYLQSHIPTVLGWLESKALPWIQQMLNVESDWFSTEQLTAEIKERAAQVDWSATGNVLGPIVAHLSKSSLALFGFLGNLALVPVVTFYLLRDWDVMMGKLRQLIPRSVEVKVVELVKECDETLGAFLKGQLLVMFALGVIYSVGLLMVGLKLALLIGMMAGLASIVPYLGFIVGIVAALVACFFQFGDWIHILMVVVVFMVGQMMEGMVLTPILVGDKIGLHPVAVIFAVLSGAQLFGFTGMLLALPVAAICVVLLRHVHEFYLASEWYDRKAELVQAGVGAASIGAPVDEASDQSSIQNSAVQNKEDGKPE